MTQTDFTLWSCRCILGGALVIMGWLSVSAVEAETVVAQGISEQGEQQALEQTIEASSKLQDKGKEQLPASATIAVSPEVVKESLASTDTAAQKSSLDSSLDSSSSAEATSLIKPNRANGLLYSNVVPKEHKESEVLSHEAQSSSLVTATATKAMSDSIYKEENQESAKSIVIFFSAPEHASAGDIDSLTGASLIDKANNRQGFTEHIARYIGQQLELEVYAIKVTPEYPLEHNALIERANAEQNTEQGEKLETRLEPQVDLTKVERIYLGFPLWWNEVPSAVSAWVKQEDLSGKIIMPFCTYSFNAPYQFFKELSLLEPNAQVERGLALNKWHFISNQNYKKVERWIAEQGNKSSKENKSTTQPNTLSVPNLSPTQTTLSTNSNLDNTQSSKKTPQ